MSVKENIILQVDTLTKLEFSNKKDENPEYKISQCGIREFCP